MPNMPELPVNLGTEQLQFNGWDFTEYPDQYHQSNVNSEVGHKSTQNPAPYIASEEGYGTYQQ
jgi:hypothetical protein